MKTIIFFDTETTGLPKSYNAPSSDTESWPRLVQLSWLVTDTDGNLLKSGNHIIRPVGFEIPEEASNVHGITQHRALAEGEDLEEVIDAFMTDAESTDLIVGHNINFDIHVVGAELCRLGREDSLRHRHYECTMRSSTSFCQIPNRRGFKFPKLQELHYRLFGSNFENAHDSSADVSATAKCYFELKRRGVM